MSDKKKAQAVEEVRQFRKEIWNEFGFYCVLDEETPAIEVLIPRYATNAPSPVVRINYRRNAWHASDMGTLYLGLLYDPGEPAGCTAKERRDWIRLLKKFGFKEKGVALCRSSKDRKVVFEYLRSLVGFVKARAQQLGCLNENPEPPLNQSDIEDFVRLGEKIQERYSFFAPHFDHYTGAPYFEVLVDDAEFSDGVNFEICCSNFRGNLIFFDIEMPMSQGARLLLSSIKDYRYVLNTIYASLFAGQFFQGVHSRMTDEILTRTMQGHWRNFWEDFETFVKCTQDTEHFITTAIIAYYGSGGDLAEKMNRAFENLVKDGKSDPPTLSEILSECMYRVRLLDNPDFDNESQENEVPEEDFEEDTGKITIN